MYPASHDCQRVQVDEEKRGLQMALQKALWVSRRIVSVRCNCVFLRTFATPNHQRRYHGNRDAGTALFAHLRK